MSETAVGRQATSVTRIGPCQAAASALLTALAVGSCTASGVPPAAAAAAAIAADLKENSDQPLVSAYPHLIKREGPTLIVGAERLTDEGDCQEGDCTRYRANGVWHGKYVGIDVRYYEDSDYLLLGTGEPLPIQSRPIPSPSGKRFFTGYHDDRSWSPYHGAAVWDWHEYPRRLRLVDSHLVMFESFTRWHGDSCVEFTGFRGGYGGGDVQPVRTYWLAEQHGDWQLLEERPPICR